MNIIVIVLIVSFAFLVAIGVPVAFSLGISGFISVVLSGATPAVFIQRMYYAFDNYTFIAIFLFMCMGIVAGKSGISKDLIDILTRILGRVRGGLAYAEIVASTIFGAISGSSSATVAAIDSVMLPEMTKKGYPKNFTVALACSTGVLGQMIPPSIGAILYGVIMHVSIGKLLMGYLIPGLLISIGFIIATFISFKNKVEGFNGIIEDSKAVKLEGESTIIILLRVVCVVATGIFSVVGIYMGLFTPTEGGAVASVLVIVLAFIFYHFTVDKLFEVLYEAARKVSVIMILISTSYAFSYVLAYSGILKALGENLLVLSGGNLFILIIFISAILIIAGMFFEGSVVLVLLGPTLGKAVSSLGYNLIQFGVLFNILLAVGMITPPVGVNLYVGCSIAKVKMENIMKYVVIFIGILILVALLVAFIPQISLWLPSFLGY